ncbi:MAG: 30S ribosomal protein S6 [Candidatus Paceibacterota bacterium]|jgi:ribosomal protein S6
MTETNAELNNEGTKIYELSYLLVPELAEEAAAHEVGALKSLIMDTFGGVEISGEAPREIDLAYQMERQIGAKKDKYTKALFGWVKFELSQDKIAEVKKVLDKNNKIIRFLIIKTVRENTMAAKKVFAGTGYKKPVGGAKGDASPMSEEELDKTIAELVVE